MSAQNDGGPAFPNQPLYSEQHGWQHPSAIGDGFAGMSLRDWFAGMALQSYLAGRNNDNRNTIPESVADTCYRYAEAMLNAREKGSK